MTHEHCAELAELYALGALDDPNALKSKEHLRECPACARLVAVAENDVALIASGSPHSPAPPDSDRRVNQLFRDERPFSFARIGALPWVLPAAVAAALMSVCFHRPFSGRKPSNARRYARRRMSQWNGSLLSHIVWQL